MDNLISRQAAIDALGDMVMNWTDSDYELGQLNQWKADRKAIIDLPSAQPQLDEWCDDCKEYDKERHCCPRFNRVIRTTLDDVRKDAMAQRWIPVTERLPERGKDVLVTRNYDGRADHIKSCRYVEVASCYGEDDDVSWNSYSDEYKMTPKNHRVVAWMPLPEPYKGEQG